MRCIVKTNQPSLLFNLFTPSIMKYWVDSDKVQLTACHPQLAIFNQKPGPTTTKKSTWLYFDWTTHLSSFVSCLWAMSSRPNHRWFLPTILLFFFCSTQLATDLSVLKACLSNHAGFAGLSLRYGLPLRKFPFLPLTMHYRPKCIGWDEW